MHREGQLYALKRWLLAPLGHIHCVGIRLLAAAGAQPIDREPAGQLADPRPDRLVVAQPSQMLVGTSEHLLKDVLGVVVAESEGLTRDRVHVA